MTEILQQYPHVIVVLVLLILMFAVQKISAMIRKIVSIISGAFIGLWAVPFMLSVEFLSPMSEVLNWCMIITGGIVGAYANIVVEKIKIPLARTILTAAIAIVAVGLYTAKINFTF